ncbi:MAG: hypothetical protein ABEH56_01585, partial [Salinirussus sp.]
MVHRKKDPKDDSPLDDLLDGEPAGEAPVPPDGERTEACDLPAEWCGKSAQPPDPPDVDRHIIVSDLEGGIYVRRAESSTAWIQYFGPTVA